MKRHQKHNQSKQKHQHCKINNNVLYGNIHGQQILLPEATFRRLLPPKVPAKLPAKLPAAPKI